MRAWSFLTLEPADRQYVANDGYPDVLGAHYAFDSTVPNHGNVAEGDLAVMRDSAVVLGLGWIDDITVTSGQKLRLRCPNCTRTGFKRRARLTPTYHCPHCQSNFDDPAKESVEVEIFVAQYARTFRAMDARMPVAALAPAYTAQAVQHAIRELRVDAVQTALSSGAALGVAFWDATGGVRPALPGGHGLRVGRFRIGQQRFRQELLKLFGNRCAFTGGQPPAALDAAHLYRYSEVEEHRTDAGLLLRRDLHGLFDRLLITIDPVTWRIRIAPELASYAELAALDGRDLKVPPPARPDVKHVRVHHELATASWAGAASPAP